MWRYNDVADFWDRAYPQAFGGDYAHTELVFFEERDEHRVRQASSQPGPFYCPADRLVYFDLDFLDQLQERVGATGDLATQYIVAHEFGHHVQNLTGQNAASSRPAGDAAARDRPRTAG